MAQRWFFNAFFLATVWPVCILPWVAFSHWIFDWSWTVLIPVSLLITIVYTYGSLKVLRNGPDWLAVLSMQFMGLGSIGWIPVLLGLLTEALVPSFRPLLPIGLIWLGMMAYGFYRAQNIENLFFNIEDSRIDKPVRMLQLSDVHIGSRSAGFLKKVVAQANSHNPDIVVITGDLVDRSRVIKTDLAPLSQLSCPTLMCIGNHERYVDLEAAMKAVKDCNVNVLRDQSIELEGINFIGIDDFDDPKHVATVLKELTIATALYNVVLYHRPDGWNAVKQHNLPLMLAGHTHNGQVWPLGLFVKMRFPRIAGWYRDGDTSLYVSSGTGTWGPTFRLGTRCEMGIFDLKPTANTS